VNYYDELGLSRSASAEEVRQAYKRLARLLHPDQQSDDQLRKMAELQMTRLNEIQAVLTDPARRARYDARLDRYLEDVAEPRHRRVKPDTVVWGSVMLAAVVAFAFLSVYFQHDYGPAPVLSAAPAADAHPTPHPTKAPRQLQRTVASAPVHEARVARVQQTVQAAQLSPSVVYPEEKRRDEAVPVVELPAAAAPVIIRTAPSLIGTWLYTKTTSSGEGAKRFSYRPEYIEMIIKRTDDGRLFGRYRGQFQVPDQALSSEVVFQFEGTLGEGANVFAWHAEDGASGQIRLRIISDSSVEASWYTTMFGNTPKLASGSAVLYRD